MQSLAYSMSGDDQRRIAFCSTYNNVFANSFPLTLAPDPSMRTCNGAYKGSLNVGAETRGDDDIEKNLQKMIPWMDRALPS